MVKATLEKEASPTTLPEGPGKKLVILDERAFISDTEGTISSGGMCGESYSIRLEEDSYVWLFSGRRGAGKSVAMTFFVVRAVILYNMRIISNYTIEFLVRRYRPDGKTYLQHIKSEPIDFEKLLLQSDEYKHVLIVLDEAPDIISHLASQTWKNRLINAFVRQIRHGFNSLFMAAQDDTLIDKSLRWQIDIETACQDVSRILGDNSHLKRGEELSLKWFDQSGQWTGDSTKDRIRKGEEPVVDEGLLHAQVLFGDATHKAVFDSWQDINILDSLFKVDMKMESIKVGNAASKDFLATYPISETAHRSLLNNVTDIFKRMKEGERAVWQKGFYNSFSGGLSNQDRSNIGKLLNECGLKRGGNKNKPWISFDGFDYDKFKAMLESHIQQNKETA